VRFDEIAHLSSEGAEIDLWSSRENLEHLKETLDQGPFLDNVVDSLIAGKVALDTLHSVPGRLGMERLGRGVVVYDYFHMNTITILPDTPLGRRDPRFAAGNLLTCLRNVDQIAILDRASKQVVWSWGEGVLEWPHHPTMLDNGNVLVFDNGAVRRYSKVIELDPVTGNVAWEYVAEPPGAFFTPQKGSAQRLPDGNTLICEGDRGRVFEVTMEGEIVWEWYNPEIKDDRRVVLYRMTRYPPEMVEPLLGREDGQQ